MAELAAADLLAHPPNASLLMKPKTIKPKTITRTRISMSCEGGNTTESAYLTTTKAAKNAIGKAAKLLGLDIVETREIEVGTKLYSGRYSRDGDFVFALHTRVELSAMLSDEALAILDETGEYDFDGDKASASISFTGVAGDPSL